MALLSEFLSEWVSFLGAGSTRYSSGKAAMSLTAAEFQSSNLRKKTTSILSSNHHPTHHLPSSVPLVQQKFHSQNLNHPTSFTDSDARTESGQPMSGFLPGPAQDFGTPQENAAAATAASSVEANTNSFSPIPRYSNDADKDHMEEIKASKDVNNPQFKLSQLEKIAAKEEAATQKEATMMESEKQVDEKTGEGYWAGPVNKEGYILNPKEVLVFPPEPFAKGYDAKGGPLNEWGETFVQPVEAPGGESVPENAPPEPAEL
jgi:hypothetical protein